MLTLLARNGALPGRAFIPQAHRDLALSSHLYGDFSDFDESEEEDSDLEPDRSDSELSEFELDSDWLKSQLDGFSPALRSDLFELFGRRRRRSILPGASNTTPRKRRFSSDSETSSRA